MTLCWVMKEKNFILTSWTNQLLPIVTENNLFGTIRSCFKLFKNSFRWLFSIFTKQLWLLRHERIWLYVIIMSYMHFRVNLYSMVPWMSRNRWSIWSLSDSNGIQTHKQLVHKQTLNNLAKLAKKLKTYICYFLSNLYFSPNVSPSKTMKKLFYSI